MKKLLLATTCLALTSTASMAADMSVPYTKAPVMAAPVFTWTGCYVGAHVGGGTMTSSVVNSEGGGSNNLNGKGAVAGGQGGCNYQDGNWVFGIEGEGYWSGINVNNNTTFFNSSGLVTESFGTSLKNENDFTIAARAGITLDRTLIYGKGGWAWGHLKGTTFDMCCGVGSTTSTGSFSGNLDGFLVGAGIEHALTRNWTVKLEYDYIGFGNKQVPFTSCSPTGVCNTGQSFTFSATKQIFKVSANYLFDFGGAPLVAKY
jgi:outer membrane immunogenic protein